MKHRLVHMGFESCVNRTVFPSVTESRSAGFEMSLPLSPPFFTGKQLLPLSSSLHAGVSQLAWQGPSGGFGGPGATGGMSAGGGEVNNLVRMRSQALGQSAPSLTGLVSTQTQHTHTTHTHSRHRGCETPHNPNRLFTLRFTYFS